MRTLGVLFAVAALIGVGPAVAWADPGEAVTAFDAVVEVDAAGDLQVTETIGYRFAGTAHHGLLRELASSRVTAVQVETPTGASAATTATKNGGYTTIRVGDPARTVSGTQTYVLHYAVGGVVDGDVLRWDFVGDGWQVPVQRATVRVTAPRPADTRRCTAAGCTATADGTAAVFAAGPLAPGSGLPVTLDYPAGTVGGTTPGFAFLGWLQLAVVVGVLGGLGWFVARTLRSPRAASSGAHRRAAAAPAAASAGWPAAAPAASAGWPAALPAAAPGDERTTTPAGRPAAAAWGATSDLPPPTPPPAAAWPAASLAAAGLPAPPPGVPPGVLGVLHSGGKGTDPVTATLLDLAVRGYFRVEEQAGRRRPRGWTLVATAPTTPDRLAPHEEALLHSAFDGRPAVTIAAVCWRPRALEAAHKALVAEAVDRGWAAKNVVAASGKAAGLAVFFIGFVAAIVNFGSFPRSFPFFFLGIGAGIVGVFVSMLFALAKPVRRTEAGDAVLVPSRAALAGAGLERVPPDRAAEVFSRSLPHAVALGLAHPWTRRFADLFALAPRGAASWYRPADPAATTLGAVTANVVGFVDAAGVRPSSTTSGGLAGSSGFSSSSSYSGGGDSGGGSSSSSGGGGSW